MIIGAFDSNRRNLGVLPPPVAKRLANCASSSTVADIRARIEARHAMAERAWARSDREHGFTRDDD